MLVAAFRPSTLDAEYARPTRGVTLPPVATGGTSIGYVHENDPEFPAADHEPAGASELAVNCPCDPPGPATAASTTGAAASRCSAGIRAVTTWVAGSLADASGDCTRHSGLALSVNAHAGRLTMRSRLP
ncbi:hypothetical protein GCM10029964_042560 [Kibdelosporangium lantanae]